MNTYFCKYIPTSWDLRWFEIPPRIESLAVFDPQDLKRVRKNLGEDFDTDNCSAEKYLLNNQYAWVKKEVFSTTYQSRPTSPHFC